MNEIVYSFCNLPKSIPIGFEGEKNYRRVCMDCTPWLEEHPAGIVQAAVKRPDDTEASLVSIAMAGNTAIWIVDAWAARYSGKGAMQFIFIVDDTVIGKSPIVALEIKKSIPVGSEPPPEPNPTWFSQILQASVIAEYAADRAEAATVHQPIIGENGNWFVWDQDTELYADTGYPASGGTSHPYLSIERNAKYLYKVTYEKIPPESTVNDAPLGACSSFVRDGRLYTNLDWDYSETASFHIVCPKFEGTAFLSGLTGSAIDDTLVGQLPYHIRDGVNRNGIMVAAHVLYNDWGVTGNGEIPLTKLPYLVLSRVTSMATLEIDLDGVLDNLYVPSAMAAMEYLMQVLVTDGTTTAVLSPKTDGSGEYEIIDATSHPELTNFLWVSDYTVERADLQDRPTGVERWNLIDLGAGLSDLRFTKAYESPDRLSEFIGIDGTDKDSTDEELEEIYDRAHAAYLTRTRNGETWQTMHSVIYSPHGMEHLWIQEDWDKDYAANGLSLDYSSFNQAMNKGVELAATFISAIGGYVYHPKEDADAFFELALKPDTENEWYFKCKWEELEKVVVPEEYLGTKRDCQRYLATLRQPLVYRSNRHFAVERKDDYTFELNEDGTVDGDSCPGVTPRTSYITRRNDAQTN